MIKTVLAWPRSVKRLVVVAVDIASALAATWLAFSLRLDTPQNVLASLTDVDTILAGLDV